MGILDVEKVEAKRAKLGLSMDDAAKRCGYAGRQGWYNLLHRNDEGITLGTLEKIAKALECKPRDLLK
jgi:DNA-binding Xre family transcriptional regulator